jgi:hypothetical protein
MADEGADQQRVGAADAVEERGAVCGFVADWAEEKGVGAVEYGCSFGVDLGAGAKDGSVEGFAGIFVGVGAVVAW